MSSQENKEHYLHYLCTLLVQPADKGLPSLFLSLGLVKEGPD